MLNVKKSISAAGLVLVAAVALTGYICFTKPLPTKHPTIQTTLLTQVPAARPGPPPTASATPLGKALVYMRIPRFGKAWLWTALEGTTQDVLAKGPGHYSGSALPGNEGNSAFAAHRAGHGDPFIDFDQLRVGDTVSLSQSGATWTYKLTTAPKIIDPNDRWVVDTFAPGRWLTLTTCWPKYGDLKRMYVRAVLINAR